jgi:hypothetical protein
VNVGRLITEAMREQRKQDLLNLMFGKLTGSLSYVDQQRAMERYCWWGWDINAKDPHGKGGLGRPGWETR